MSVQTSDHGSDLLREDKTVDADVVVIGGGAAGLNGALMLVRSRRSVVVIDSGTPRNAPAAAMHGFIALDGTPPSEIIERGRWQVRAYGGRIVFGEVISAEPAQSVEPAEPVKALESVEPAEADAGDLRFAVTLADGRRVTARRVLVATGVRDVLPDVPVLAEHWGRSVVHCPYCHGWEVRDEPIGILATGPASLHQALLFRQLTDDLVYFTQGTVLNEDTRARFAARGIRIVETDVREVVEEDGVLTGLRLVDGTFVARRVIAVATRMQARTEGLEGLKLPMEDLPDDMGRRFVSAAAGTTDVPGVWVAGNATDPTSQVGASAAAGALAGAHINALLATADADAALAVARSADTSA
ncbi:NAD(P)/FAD-dependent oxidoreductase [Streptomyces venezuelae]|uniref:NAD(P)/FAD-dependent oxidoreductase n=1 Tax=Streptomyces venezuelae TaxID=54571 RepID=UPI00364F7E89